MLLLWIFLLNCCPFLPVLGLSCLGAISQSEYNALYTLYNSTNGPDWLWDLGVNGLNKTSIWTFPSNLTAPCNNYWQGIICSSSNSSKLLGDKGDCYISSLQAKEQNIRGKIPPDLQQLSGLQILEFSSNFIAGTIPEELGNLTALTRLSLDNNRLTGSIPSSIGQLTSLLTFSVYSNSRISGTIPSELCQLTSLTVLLLQENFLSGTIPECIGQLSNVEEFFVFSNQLSGTIPTSIGQMTSLVELYLYDGNLTGSIPTEIGQLRALEILELQENQLNGTLPTEIVHLRYLEILYLYNNELTGTLPPYLGNMSSIYDFELYDNFFHGTVPPVIFTLPKMSIIDLTSNSFTGQLPRAFSPSLVSLNLNSNLFDGTIHSSMGDNSILLYLSINSNLLTGSIPETFRFFQYLYLEANYLTGTLSGSLTAQVDLKFLSIFTNLITGTIPSDFGTVFRVQEFDFGGNKLNGTIPANIDVLVKLQYFYLDHNEMTGTLPSVLGSMQNLQLFWIEGNSFSGTVPKQFGNMTQLQQISMFSNQFTGTLPTELGLLTDLTRIAVSDNSFSGTICSELIHLTQLHTLNASGNNFGGNLYSLFPHGESFSNLTTVDVSGNALTGTIPDGLFKLKSLQVLSLYSNCFSGSIPDGICSATNVIVLAIGSLSTSSSCTLRLPLVLNLIAKGLFPIHHLEGTIPSCVWSLPQLSNLHVSGNGLKGTIGDIPGNSSLSILSLAHNQMTGSIPLSLQTAGRFSLINLVNNKFSGYLSPQFAVSNDSSIQFSRNRLSGTIPEVLMPLNSISILTGNIFECPNNQLPANDPESDTYVCGSNNLNVSAYLWASLLGVCIITVWVVQVLIPLIRSHHVVTDPLLKNEIIWSVPVTIPGTASADDSHSTNIDIDNSHASNNAAGDSSKQLKQTETKQFDCIDVLFQIGLLISRWWNIKLQLHPSLLFTTRFLELMSRANFTFLVLIVFYLAVALLSYLVLKLVPAYASKYSTHDFQYGWITTSAYLHGDVPAALVLVYSLLSGLVILYSMLNNVRIQAIFTRMNSSLSLNEKSQRTWCDLMRMSCWAVSVQLMNTTVSLAVNMGYVTAAIRGNYSPTVLLIIQACMSFYKIVWSSVYIPWAIQRISFLPERHLMRHEVFMNLVNFIVAPSLATFLTDSDCLYYAIIGQSAITSTYQSTSNSENCVGSVVDVQIANTHYINTVTHCSQTGYVETVYTSLNPPWFYSYQCGSALLVNYIPVLFYVYALSGILLPLLKLAMILSPTQAMKLFPRYLCEIFIGGTIFSYHPPVTTTHSRLSAAGLTSIKLENMESNSDKVCVVNPVIRDMRDNANTENNGNSASSNVEKYMLSQPLSLFNLNRNPSKRTLLRGGNVVAKRLLDFAILSSFGLASPILGVAIGVQMFSNMALWRLLIGRYLYGYDHLEGREEQLLCSKLEKATEPSTKGVLGSLWMVVAIVSLFWCLMVFDMVADVYGTQAGEITAIVSSIGPLVVFPIFMSAVGYCQVKTGKVLIARSSSSDVNTIQLRDISPHSTTSAAHDDHDDDGLRKSRTNRSSDDNEDGEEYGRIDRQQSNESFVHSVPSAGAASFKI